MRPNSRNGIVDNKATEKSRGASARRWPIETILKRGYGIATVYCGDIDPDFHDGFKNGVHALLRDNKENRDIKINSDEWSTISAWSWGLSRAME